MIRRTSTFHMSLQLTCFHHTSPLNTQAHMASRRQLKMEWNAPECNSSSKGGDSRLLKDCCTAWLPSFFKSCVVCHHQHRHHRGIHRRSRAWWHFRKPLVLIRFRWSIEERSRRSGGGERLEAGCKTRIRESLLRILSKALCCKWLWPQHGSPQLLAS